MVKLRHCQIVERERDSQLSPASSLQACTEAYFSYPWTPQAVQEGQQILSKTAVPRLKRQPHIEMLLEAAEHWIELLNFCYL